MPLPKPEQPTFNGLFDLESPKKTPTTPAQQPGLLPNLAAPPSMLLEEEYRPHFEAWKAAPTPENTGRLMQAVEPVLRSALRTYASQGDVSPMMRSRAKLIAIESLPRYDPTRAKLRTHLMINLQSLRRAQAEENLIVSVPERVRLDQYRLHRASQELADRLGREPSDAELSAHTGLSLRRLAHVRQVRQGVSEGQVESSNREMGDTGSAAVGIERPQNDDTWVRFIYADLDPRDQFIMERVLGLHGHSVMPKGEIARKLGLSAGAVSQRAARIQKLLDSREELAGNLF